MVRWLRIHFSTQRGSGLIPDWGAKIPRELQPKKQSMKRQKQYCNKFNKDFKNGPHFFFKLKVVIKMQTFGLHSSLERASLVVHMLKNLPAMQETQVRFLVREDPLEKEMATYSSILTWRIPWTEEPRGLQSMG